MQVVRKKEKLMCVITVIASRHSELGRCNSDELYKILERLSPDAIFEEVPPGKFPAVYAGRLRDSLETSTIKRYLEQYPTVHHAVDLEIDQETYSHFRKAVRSMTWIFNDRSPEYNRLSYELQQATEQFGFPYLNSDECSELLARKRVLEVDMTCDLKLEKLSETHRHWLDLIDRRRDEMIKNIYEHIKLHNYNQTRFIVGAEHRKPIRDKIGAFEKWNGRGPKWDFDYLTS